LQKEKNMKNLNGLKDRGLNSDFLLKHIEFKLQFAKESARANYPGSFNSVMKGISGATNWSIEFLQANVDSKVDVDDVVSYITAEVDEVRAIVKPNAWPKDYWPEVSDVMDKPLEKLRTTVQKIKAQRAQAAQEHLIPAHA
jgi:hypothetical protein